MNVSSTDDDYFNKIYTREGLAVYDNRVQIIDGGYYTDENKVTWVNITFKALKDLPMPAEKTGSWFTIYNLPAHKNFSIVTDTKGRYPFIVTNSQRIWKCYNIYWLQHRRHFSWNRNIKYDN